MALAFLLALQAAAVPGPAATPARPAPPAFAAIDFDLGRLPPGGAAFDLPGQACRNADPATILVCARRGGAGAYPLEEWARIFETRPFVAEIGLGGGATARAYGESVTLDRGAVSNRAMVGIRFPF
jgi:hypothetical protein